MLKSYPRIYLFIFLSSIFIFACSQAPVQTKKETSEPDCKKNYTQEGSWIFGRVYKTWVKYDNLDFKKGFDAVVMTLQASGNQIISTDRESGTIGAQMAFGALEKNFYPAEIKLVKEKTSLIIYISSKAAGWASDPKKLCSFYDEFEKLIKRGSAAPQPKQTTVPPKKSTGADKDSTPPAPPMTTPKPSSTPPPSPPPKTPPSRAEVIWTSVNLREGPGTNYKVIGKVKKGTTLPILEEKKGWLCVRLGDGTEAWISKTATSEVIKASSPPPPPVSRTTDSPKPKSPM